MASDTEYFELLEPSEIHSGRQSRSRGNSRFLNRKFIIPLFLWLFFIVTLISVVASYSKSSQRSKSSSEPPEMLTNNQTNVTSVTQAKVTRSAVSSIISTTAASVATTGTTAISQTVNKTGAGKEVKGLKSTILPVPSTSKPKVTTAKTISTSDSSITVATTKVGEDVAGHADDKTVNNATHDSKIHQPIPSQAASHTTTISSTTVTAVKSDDQVKGRTEVQIKATSESTHLPTHHPEPTASKATSSTAKSSPIEATAVTGGGEVAEQTVVKSSSVPVVTISSTSKPTAKTITIANTPKAVATTKAGAGHADDNKTVNANHDSKISEPIPSQAASNTAKISSTAVTAVKSDEQVKGRTEGQLKATSGIIHLPNPQPTMSNAAKSIKNSPNVTNKTVAADVAE